MEGIRDSGRRAAGVLGVLALLLMLAPASATAATTQVRTLLLTDRLSPASVPAQATGAVQPHHMLAQPGEEEGFMLAIRPSATTSLDAVVEGSSSSFMRQWTQLLRTEWVTVRRPSTGTGARAGRYADPLPPFVSGAGDAGRLTARGGEWSGIVVLVSVPAATASGTYSGSIAVRERSGTVIARVPYSVTVVQTRNAQGAADPAIAPHDPRNFKLLFNFNPNWYRALAPAKTLQEQWEQSYRTQWMLARHRAGTNVWQRAYPTAAGTYDCSSADGYLKAYHEMPWWADGRPGAIPIALLPNHTIERCQQPAFTIRRNVGRSKFQAQLADTRSTAWFIYRMADHWRKAGVQDHRAYFLNPFDEPSPAQQRSVVPSLNKLVKTYAPGVKVLGTTWPQASNAHLRDGRDADDLDGWVVPYFRSFGFGTSKAQRAKGRNRSREIVQRLQTIRKQGGEAWTYDLPVTVRQVPQLAIDAPATDTRFLFWPLGREGFNGWFIAVSNRWVNPRATSTRRNPWDDPLSFVGAKAGVRGAKGTAAAVSNGWGSLYYPAVRPQLGLTDPLAQPVTSLRLVRMRDGVEDVNLMRQYRDRFGQAALNRRLSGVVGPLRANKALPGNETFPTRRTAGLALRMERARRLMLAELAK